MKISFVLISYIDINYLSLLLGIRTAVRQRRLGPISKIRPTAENRSETGERGRLPGKDAVLYHTSSEGSCQS